VYQPRFSRDPERQATESRTTGMTPFVRLTFPMALVEQPRLKVCSARRPVCSPTNQDSMS
jgi:hypothetical protein